MTHTSKIPSPEPVQSSPEQQEVSAKTTEAIPALVQTAREAIEEKLQPMRGTAQWFHQELTSVRNQLTESALTEPARRKMLMLQHWGSRYEKIFEELEKTAEKLDRQHLPEREGLRSALNHFIANGGMQHVIAWKEKSKHVPYDPSYGKHPVTGAQASEEGKKKLDEEFRGVYEIVQTLPDEFRKSTDVIKAMNWLDKNS